MEDSSLGLSFDVMETPAPVFQEKGGTPSQVPRRANVILCGDDGTENQDQPVCVSRRLPINLVKGRPFSGIIVPAHPRLSGETCSVPESGSIHTFFSISLEGEDTRS